MKMLSNNLKLLMIFSALIVSSCGEQQTADGHLQSAKQFITNSQPKEALVELKNALSKQQDLHQARYILGKLYLEQGDFLAAEIEFNKLVNAGHSTPELIVSLAQARHLLEEHQTIPELWGARDELSKTQVAQLGFYTYIAFNRLEDNVAIEKVVEELFFKVPEQTYTKLVIAYQQSAKQQINEAKKTVDTILLAEPTNTDALLFNGQLSLFQKNYAAAASAFKEYLTFIPNHTLVELFVADALFKDKQYEQSTPYVDTLLKKAPNFGYANYLRGMILFTQNDFQAAKLHLEKAIQTNTNVEQAKLYAGLSAYRTENYEQSYEYLSDVVDSIPNNDEIRRLLSTVQFKLGYNIEASDSIAQLTEVSEADLNLVNNAAFSYLRAGKPDEANELIKKISEMDSENAKEIAKLGMLKVTMSDMSGIVDIQKAIELDDNLEQAKVALVDAYLSQGLSKEALEVAEQWVKDSPDNVMSYNLAGFAAVQHRDVDLAEKYLLKALELKENNSASLMFLASKAQSENDLEKASEFLGKLVNGNPSYIPGLVNNYLISKQLGNTKPALELMRLAVKASPKNTPLALLYARALFTEKQYDAVVKELSRLPESTSMPEFKWAASIDSYLKMNNTDKAQSLSESWVSFYPMSERAWATAIQLSGLLGTEKTITVIKKALKSFPNNQQLHLMLVDAHLSLGQIDKIRAIIQKQEKLDEAGIFDYYKSYIDYSEKKYSKVLDNYTEKSIDTLMANDFILLVKTYKKLNKKDKALETVNKGLNAHEASTNLMFEKATLVRHSETKEAKRLYQKVLELNPKHILALNNFANLYFDLNENSHGIELANKAFSLAPNFLPVVDTFARSYVVKEDFKNARAIYIKLYKVTNDVEFEFKIINTYIQEGKREEAIARIDAFVVPNQMIKERLKKLKESI